MTITVAIIKAAATDELTLLDYLTTLRQQATARQMSGRQIQPSLLSKLDRVRGLLSTQHGITTNRMGFII